ncbi:hypothetical protein [uncultured Thiodictyon sp.]|jgi:hypothetical protein|uniref:hypothetical protein n=1 Tax=uncultured Thiodictyon sp. TaxID=1846217 RepID=UPI0025D33038|nr:hypothetical protein [uncultured Thiodictyon sp.]
MEPATWTDRITAWRAAPDGARARARWERIPDNVAQSMAFEREPAMTPRAGRAAGPAAAPDLGAR